MTECKMNYLWVFLGGGLGSVARLACSGFIARHLGETFPWGTLLVNVSGSLVIGWFASMTAPEGRWMVSPSFRQFFMIGICGGYTTFSSFSLQTLNLIQDGQWFKAVANTVLSFVLCMVAVWLGYWLGTTISSTKGF